MAPCYGEAWQHAWRHVVAMCKNTTSIGNMTILKDEDDEKLARKRYLNRLASQRKRDKAKRLKAAMEAKVAVVNKHCEGTKTQHYSDKWQSILRLVENLPKHRDDGDDMWKDHCNKSGILKLVRASLHHKICPATRSISEAFEYVPNVANVLVDVESEPSSKICQSNVEATADVINDEEDFNFHKLLRSMMGQGAWCLCAFDIRLSKGGLGVCKPRNIDLKGDQDLDSYTSITNAAGYVTSPHIDSTLSTGTTFMVMGQKLWYSWPLNTHNASIWTPDMMFGDCICRLDDLSITHLAEGEGIIVPAGTIHGVISLTPACLVGCRIY